MHILTFLNRKGGVGKTSLTFHLSGALAEAGRSVIVADLDPQASLTQAFIGPVATEALDKFDSIYSAFTPGGRTAAEILMPTSIPGLSLYPGHDGMKEVNSGYDDDAVDIGFMALREYVRGGPVADFLFFDPPPNLMGCAWAALGASDFLVMPLEPEAFAAMGIEAVLAFLGRVQVEANPGVQLLGMALNKVQARLNVQTLYRNAIREARGAEVFDVELALRSAQYSEAITAMQPVTHYKPKGDGAEDVRRLAAELVARVEASTSAPSKASAGKVVA